MTDGRTDLPQTILAKWKRRAERSGHGLAYEAYDDLVYLDRNFSFWKLPPLPDYPRIRVVVDCKQEFSLLSRDNPHDMTMALGWADNSEVVLAKFVAASQKTLPPDPIPERAEKALHCVIGCCDQNTGECDGKAVRDAWDSAK